VPNPPPYLGELSDDDAEWLKKNGELWQVAAGDVIITEEVPPDYVFVVLEGEFEVISNRLNDPDIPPVGPGELLGEMSYLERRKPRNSVRAVAGGALWSIPRSSIDAADEGFRRRFVKVLQEFAQQRMRDYKKAQGGEAPSPDPPPIDPRVIEIIERLLRDDPWADEHAP